MKKMLLSLGLLGITFSLFGCGHTPSATKNIDGTPISYTGYINKKQNFSLDFPTTWSFQENKYGADVIFFTPQGTGDDARENFSITIQSVTSGMSLDTSYENIKTKLQESMNGLSIIDEDTLDIAGIAAKKVIYANKEGDIKPQREQILFIKDGKMYLLTYTALTTTFEDFESIIGKMITSFAFTK